MMQFKDGDHCKISPGSKHFNRGPSVSKGCQGGTGQRGFDGTTGSNGATEPTGQTGSRGYDGVTRPTEPTGRLY